MNTPRDEKDMGVGGAGAGAGAGYRDQFKVTTMPIKYRLGFYNDLFIK